MVYILLVWEEVPEDHKMYLIPYNEGVSYMEFFKEAHMHFINEMDWHNNSGLRFLNNALIEDPASVPDEDMLVYAGIFAPYKVDLSKPITDKVITHVFLSGFLL